MTQIGRQPDHLARRVFAGPVPVDHRAHREGVAQIVDARPPAMPLVLLFGPQADLLKGLVTRFEARGHHPAFQGLDQLDRSTTGIDRAAIIQARCSRGSRPRRRGRWSAEPALYRHPLASSQSDDSKWLAKPSMRLSSLCVLGLHGG